MPKRRYGQYELIARLAAGMFGDVFLACRRNDGIARLVCLKIANDSDPLQARSFLSEAHILEHLDHDNCVRIHDVGSANDRHYVATEYIWGETLERIMEQARAGVRIPPKVAAMIVAAVCRGLHRAHELKSPTGEHFQVVHRDVSPHNIIVSFDGTPKIIDFGIAKTTTGTTQEGVVKGKICYMAPEQINGETIDRRTDIFALGIILHECLTNTRAFEGLTPEQVTWKLYHEPLPPPSTLVRGVAPSLDSICMRALASAPDERFLTAKELATALDEHIGSTEGPLLGDFIQTRFGYEYRHQRVLIESVLKGDYDEAEVAEGLGALPLRTADLPPFVVLQPLTDEAFDAEEKTERAEVPLLDSEPTVISSEEALRPKVLPPLMAPDPHLSTPRMNATPSVKSWPDLTQDLVEDPHSSTSRSERFAVPAQPDEHDLNRIMVLTAVVLVLGVLGGLLLYWAATFF